MIEPRDPGHEEPSMPVWLLVVVLIGWAVAVTAVAWHFGAFAGLETL